jgi:light-regulated signal transduction histidine kinase (bacteriophytochrome)
MVQDGSNRSIGARQSADLSRLGRAAGHRSGNHGSGCPLRDVWRAAAHCADRGGHPQHVFGPVDLSAVLDDVLEVYSPAAEEKNQTLTREIPPGISVSGDRALLTQMFANLVESAIRHSSTGACVEVELQAPANVDGPQVTIGHDGPGISGVGTRQGFPPLLSARREPFDPRQRARFGLGRRGRRFARRHYPSVRKYSRWFTGST